MRLRLVPGRRPGAALAATGVLLAVPSIFWPVLASTTFASDDLTFSGQSSTQENWSWGALQVSGFGENVPDPGFQITNTLGLVSLVLAVILGAGAAAVWAFLRFEGGRSLGVGGVAFLAATQVVLLGQWQGERQSFWGSDATTLTELQPTGWLQIASVVVLFVALGLMMWRPLRTWIAPTWRGLNGAEPETVGIEGTASEESLVSTTDGTAHLREVEDGDAGLSDGPTRRRDAWEVGFSDNRRERSRDKRRTDPRR